MSAIIKGKNITYETAYLIYVSRLTKEDIMKKFKVSLQVVKDIKNCVFLDEIGQKSFNF